MWFVYNVHTRNQLVSILFQTLDYYYLIFLILIPPTNIFKYPILFSSPLLDEIAASRHNVHSLTIFSYARSRLVHHNTILYFFIFTWRFWWNNYYYLWFCFYQATAFKPDVYCFRMKILPNRIRVPWDVACHQIVKWMIDKNYDNKLYECWIGFHMPTILLVPKWNV